MATGRMTFTGSSAAIEAIEGIPVQHFRIAYTGGKNCPPTLRALTSNDSFRMHRSDTGHGRHQGDKCLTISGELGATCLRANAELRDRKAQRTSLLSRNFVP